MLLEKARREVALAAQQIHRLGLVRGTAGNVSARDPDTGYLVVTPSAVPYESIGPEEIIVMTAEGAVVEGRLRPSSEAPMHTSVYQNRSWAHGIVHTHSVYATTFACLGEEIRAAHYMIAFVGRRIPVARYAPYGTPELGRAAVEALGEGRAVLLKNHGVLVAGRTLGEAVSMAETVEYVAEIYYRTRTIGTPSLIPDEELDRLSVRFETYHPEEIL